MQNVIKYNYHNIGLTKNHTIPTLLDESLNK